MPVKIFSQSSDDLDGDGVLNSEDACPNTKGIIANKGCPGKNEPTPTFTPAPKSVNLSISHTALSDCRFVIEDMGCNRFFGKSKPAIVSIFGQPEGYGDYSKLGLFFYFNVDLVDEITFFGVPDKYHEAFYGKPAKNLDWNATMEEVIRLYGEPTNRWESSDKTESGIRYDETLRLEFQNNKLAKIILRDPKADSRYLARRAAESEKESRETQQRETQTKAQNVANQMEADYKELLDQLDAKLREGERIINSEKLAIAAGGMFKDAVRKKIDKVRTAGDNLIDSFGKKYQGKIPAWMIKGIQEKWQPVPYPQ